MDVLKKTLRKKAVTLPLIGLATFGMLELISSKMRAAATQPVEPSYTAEWLHIPATDDRGETEEVRVYVNKADQQYFARFGPEGRSWFVVSDEPQRRTDPEANGWRRGYEATWIYSTSCDQVALVDNATIVLDEESNKFMSDPEKPRKVYRVGREDWVYPEVFARADSLQAEIIDELKANLDERIRAGLAENFGYQCLID